MEMQTSSVGEVTKVMLTGRLDSAGVTSIERTFAAEIVPLGKPAIVDLSQIAFLASLGVRMLISTARALSGKGAKLVLYGANSAVTEIIETTSLNDIVPLAITEAEALARATA